MVPRRHDTERDRTPAELLADSRPQHADKGRNQRTGPAGGRREHRGGVQSRGKHPTDRVTDAHRSENDPQPPAARRHRRRTLIRESRKEGRRTVEATHEQRHAGKGRRPERLDTAAALGLGPGARTGAKERLHPADRGQRDRRGSRGPREPRTSRTGNTRTAEPAQCARRNRGTRPAAQRDPRHRAVMLRPQRPDGTRENDGRRRNDEACPSRGQLIQRSGRRQTPTRGQRSAEPKRELLGLDTATVKSIMIAADDPTSEEGRLLVRALCSPSNTLREEYQAQHGSMP